MVLGLVALLALSATGSGAASVVSPGRIAAAGANASWGIGVEALLPSNAATTKQKASINSVSCSSAWNCGAVGTYVDSLGHSQGLLLTETAGAWATGVEAHLPANADTGNPSVRLNSISCPSAGNCSAVGGYVDNTGSNYAGLTLRETAGTWAVGVEVVLPANASVAQPTAPLSSVSCSSAGNCTAVGGYQIDDQGGSTEALLVTEAAGSWAAGIEAVLPANATVGLEIATLVSVSCASAGNCAAVGVYNLTTGDSATVGPREGLLLTQTGGAWATGVEAPLPADANSTRPNAGLDSVSCPSAGNCTAVGSYATASDTEGLLLSENAGTWETGVEAVLPANAEIGFPGPLYSLDSISCASAGNCSAVGTYMDNSGSGWGLLLTETDGTWAKGVEAALPANALTTQQFVGLSSVSCPSAGNCQAVGGYDLSPGGAGGLLLTQSGGTWARGVEAALPADGSDSTPINVTSVSCPSVGNCAAVGLYPLSTGGSVEGLLLNSPAPAVRLTVSKSGTGAGSVSSSPAGIECGTTCSHNYPQGTSVTLTAAPAAGSTFVGWSGPCAGTGTCAVRTDADATVSATFEVIKKPKPCVVPKLKGKTLAAAKVSIKAHACAVGRVRHAVSRAITKNHVISQKPKPGTRRAHGAKVSVVVSKGRG